MNTKKIWIMSLVFGILMAFVAYIAIFSNQSEPAMSENNTKKTKSSKK